MTLPLPATPPGAPGYLRLLHSGELARRVETLEALLGPTCRVCPRLCAVDRAADELGPCFAGARAAVSKTCDHHGEEPPIAGAKGSGTVFFSNCNLRCVYCQNHQISQQFKRGSAGENRPGELEPAELAERLLNLQARGCHNINFVSPTHYVPQLARAVLLAAGRGLHLPIVYNTNAYDSLEAIRLLDGIVDIYLPDLKYGDNAVGQEYSRVNGYVDHARAAIAEMWRQVGPLQLGGDGLARRGLIIRHLVLPNDLADSELTLDWIKVTLGTGVTLSLMAQYYPTNKAERYTLINRRITSREYVRVIEYAQKLGFTELLIQDEHIAPEYYQPDFSQEHPFHY
jgi:putative pyruvate formate lyase activating enzyme